MPVSRGLPGFTVVVKRSVIVNQSVGRIVAIILYLKRQNHFHFRMWRESEKSCDFLCVMNPEALEDSAGDGGLVDSSLFEKTAGIQQEVPVPPTGEAIGWATAVQSPLSRPGHQQTAGAM
jgi:hypothetical protein